MKSFATLVATVVCLVAASRVQGELTHYYPFDTDANDVVGINDGFMSNGASIVNDPQRGAVLGLDGVNDWVSLANSNVPGGPTDTTVFSIAVWVNIFAEGDQRRIGGFYGEYRNGQVGTKNFFTNGSAADVRFQFEQTPPSGNNIQTAASFDDDMWHHVVYVQNEPGSFRQKIYVDGVLEAADNLPERYTGPSPNIF